MSDKAAKLIWQMILATMEGKKKKTWAIYDRYILETRLHVPIKEYLDWRKGQVG